MMESKTAKNADRVNCSVIILTKNEEKNLPDCLASISGLEARVFVVDSGSTDATREIAAAAGCDFVHHDWENYSKQRNWAFENLPLHGDWVLCLDADERLLPETAKEIGAIASDAMVAADGFMLRKRTYFMGRWIRHGGHYPTYHLRLGRRGKMRCEDRLYDQHFVVDGKVERLESDYIDILTDSLTTWTDRHNTWATLEAREMLAGFGGEGRVAARLVGGSPIERRRWLREGFYARFPLFLRALLYFLQRYILRGGFRDGKEGLIFHVLQGFWFRFLVDAKVFEMTRQRALEHSEQGKAPARK